MRPGKPVAKTPDAGLLPVFYTCLSCINCDVPPVLLPVMCKLDGIEAQGRCWRFEAIEGRHD